MIVPPLRRAGDDVVVGDDVAARSRRTKPEPVPAPSAPVTLIVTTLGSAWAAMPATEPPGRGRRAGQPAPAAGRCRRVDRLATSAPAEAAEQPGDEGDGERAADDGRDQAPDRVRGAPALGGGGACRGPWAAVGWAADCPARARPPASRTRCPGHRDGRERSGGTGPRAAGGTARRAVAGRSRRSAGGSGRVCPRSTGWVDPGGPRRLRPLASSWAAWSSLMAGLCANRGPRARAREAAPGCCRLPAPADGSDRRRRARRPARSDRRTGATAGPRGRGRSPRPRGSRTARGRTWTGRADAGHAQAQRCGGRGAGGQPASTAARTGERCRAGAPGRPPGRCGRHRQVRPSSASPSSADCSELERQSVPRRGAWTPAAAAPPRPRRGTSRRPPRCWSQAEQDAGAAGRGRRTR